MRRENHLPKSNHMCRAVYSGGGEGGTATRAETRMAADACADGSRRIRHGRLRAQHPGRRFRRMAVTGWGQDGDRQRVWEAGFDEHLVKPAGGRGAEGGPFPNRRQGCAPAVLGPTTPAERFCPVAHCLPPGVRSGAAIATSGQRVSRPDPERPFRTD